MGHVCVRYNKKVKTVSTKNMFSTGKILDQMKLHLEVPDDDSRTRAGACLYADDVDLGDDKNKSERASHVEGPDNKMLELTNNIPLAISALMSSNHAGRGRKCSVFDVIIKSIVRKLFYAGQVSR